MKRTNGLTLPEAEPAVVRGIVVAVALLASMGVGWAADVDADTITVWALAAAPLVPILQALWTRYATVPNAKVVARVSKSQGVVVAGDAAVTPTGDELETYAAPGAPAVTQVRVRPELLRE